MSTLKAGPRAPSPTHHVEVAADDETLVARTRGGDEIATGELLERYRGFARAKARAYFLIGGDREDIVQEGMIGLYKAIRDYDAEHGASFRSFAELCITRQILTAIKTATRHKHAPLNTSVSFDRPHDADSGRTVGDSLLEHGADPLALVVESDDVSRLRGSLERILSGLEGEVLDLYVSGCSYQEIAERLGRRVKSIDNALQRIKRKVEAHLSETAA